MTNFHLPESSLLMLACAFGGRDAVLAAYREAVEQRYRFYSYGDAMLYLNWKMWRKCQTVARGVLLIISPLLSDNNLPIYNLPIFQC